MIQSGFFQHIYHIGCAFNLHSIINNGLIPGEIRKGLTFYKTRSNATILQETLPAYCIPKVVRLKTGEVLYEKAYMSPRPPPKISLRHDWAKELGSKVARQPRGEVSRQAKFFQPTQPIPKPICDRSGQLDITPSVIRAQTDLSGEIRVEQTHDRSGQLDKHNVALQDAPEVHRDITTLNTDNELTRERIEEDMDFKILGLPTTFYCEAIAECQHSRIDSENREPPEPTCSSTRPTKESII